MTASMLNSVTLISRLPYKNKKPRQEFQHKMEIVQICWKILVQYDRITVGVGILGAHSKILRAWTKVD